MPDDSNIISFRDGSPIRSHPESSSESESESELAHTCDSQHPDDPTACWACVEQEAPMLVCTDCGEAFDEIIPAYAHTTTDEDGLPIACGLDFRILPRDEAL